MLTLVTKGSGVHNVDVIFLQKGHALTGQYCTTLPRQVDGNVIAKRRRKLIKGAPPCHHGNARAHRSPVAVTVIYNSGFEPIDQKPFSKCNNNNVNL